jgi:hypothetical protein
MSAKNAVTQNSYQDVVADHEEEKEFGKFEHKSIDEFCLPFIKGEVRRTEGFFK